MLLANWPPGCHWEKNNAEKHTKVLGLMVLQFIIPFILLLIQLLHTKSYVNKQLDNTQLHWVTMLPTIHPLTSDGTNILS